MTFGHSCSYCRKKEREMAKASRQQSEVDLQALLKGGAGKMRGMVTGTVRDKLKGWGGFYARQQARYDGRG